MNNRTDRTDTQRIPREERMLSAVVDAMLESQADLEDATLDQWDQILFDSCRKQRERQAARHITLVAA